VRKLGTRYITDIIDFLQYYNKVSCRREIDVSIRDFAS